MRRFSKSRTPLLGAETGAGRTRFGAFTTRSRTCSIALALPDGRTLSKHPMQAMGSGYFAADLPNVGHGALYRFALDDRELPDPYARFLPRGVHGPAMVVSPTYEWKYRPATRPLREQVIYELHVGTFTPQGTYAAARSHLAELAELGITTIELMPLSSFPGTRGWGYDGVAHFAPFAGYGSPNDLRAFVDEAHRLGLLVLLDVVYNHFGPSGNYLSAYSPEYFTPEAQTAWGEGLNFARPVVRRYVLENAVYWLTDFRFDGLRLDAIHAIVDRSAKHILQELTETVATIEPRKFLIAEDDRNDPTRVSRFHLDAIWSDDFHHQLRTTLTRERDGYYGAYAPGCAGLADTIRQGWLYQGQLNPIDGQARGAPATALQASCFVYCIQNHDQIGNRALGRRLSEDVPIEAYLAASMLLLLLPMTPLLFMGQEWAATSPFLYFTDHDKELGKRVSEGRREEFKLFTGFSDPAARAEIPDPQSPDTFAQSRLRWQERDTHISQRVLALYRETLWLRRNDPVFRNATREHLSTESTGSVLSVRIWQEFDARLLFVNLSDTPVPLADLPVPAGGFVPLLSSNPRTSAAFLSEWSALLLGGTTDEKDR